MGCSRGDRSISCASVVGEYIVTATPVGSETVVRKYGLGVSPATVRNDTAELETEGYVLQPHTSAGRIPSDTGYRYYVECLMGDAKLPPEEQRTIRHQFHQVERELDEWPRLTASILARTVRNAALVSTPRTPQTRLRHMELVELQERLALLVLVFQEAKLRKQVLSFDTPISRDRLTALTQRLNSLCSSLTCAQMKPKTAELSAAEEHVFQSVLKLMHDEDQSSFGDIQLDGLRHILAQPEFANSRKIQQLLEVLEEKTALKALLPHLVTDNGVQVVIGQEHGQEVMQECSVVMASYGIPGQLRGAWGVLGPTRMPYSRAVSAVHYLSSVISDLLMELGG